MVITYDSRDHTTPGSLRSRGVSGGWNTGNQRGWPGFLLLHPEEMTSGRNLYDKFKMAAQPGKKPIASITEGFLTFRVVLLHRIPFDKTLLPRTV